MAVLFANLVSVHDNLGPQSVFCRSRAMTRVSLIRLTKSCSLAEGTFSITVDWSVLVQSLSGNWQMAELHG
jgi:hypothetical protein